MFKVWKALENGPVKKAEVEQSFFKGWQVMFGRAVVQVKE